MRIKVEFEDVQSGVGGGSVRDENRDHQWTFE